MLPISLGVDVKQVAGQPGADLVTFIMGHYGDTLYSQRKLIYINPTPKNDVGEYSIIQRYHLRAGSFTTADDDEFHCFAKAVNAHFVADIIFSLFYDES